MKLSSILTIAAAGLLAVAVAGTTLAQEAEGQAEAPDMDAMMAAYMKLAEPGEHHKHLDQLAGSWDFTAKFWSPTGGEPQESGGTLDATWVMGGRFLRSEVTGSVMEMPFTGMALEGYDNLNKQYNGMWVDTMGTMMMNYEGQCETDGRVRTMHSEFTDPMSGQKMKNKTVTTILNDNSYMYESFVVLPDGNEFKQMELVAKRRS